MNARLNFLYFISNIHYSLSPGYGFWFFFRQKERPPLLRSRFLVLFSSKRTTTPPCVLENKTRFYQNLVYISVITQKMSKFHYSLVFFRSFFTVVLGDTR